MTKKAVAVVAVHGVADQKPGSSVRSLGDLLLRLRDDGLDGGREVYQGFREITLRIPLRPVHVADRAAAGGAGAAASSSTPAGGSMNERPAYVLDELTAPVAKSGAKKGQQATASAAPPPDPPPHHLFHRSLVEGYPGSRGSYETVRLEGERADGRPVHVYELYWADLSRVGRGLVAILGAFYQLALHLPHLGRLTVDHALFEHRGDRTWKWFAGVHAWAVRVLTLFLPLMVLFQLMAVLGLLPGALPAKPWFAVGALVVAGLVIGGRWRYHRRPSARWRTWHWWLLPVAAALAGGLLGLLLLAFRPGGRPPLLTPDQLLLLQWTALASLACFVVMNALDTQRPGTRRWGERLWLPLFLIPMLAVALAGNGGSYGVDARTQLAGWLLWIFELQLNLALVVAFALYALAVVSGCLGLLVVLREKKRSAPRRRARRVAWTALVSLALSTVLFYLGTLVIGAGALYAARPLLPGADAGSASAAGGTDPTHLALLPSTHVIFEGTLADERATAGDSEPPVRLTQSRALGYLLRLGATSGITLLVIALVATLFIAAFGFAPAVWKEVRGPTGERARDLRGSESLGLWLDRTFGALAGVLILLFVAAFVLLPAASLLRLSHVFFGLDEATVPLLGTLVAWLWESNGLLLGLAGAVVAASAVGLAFHGRLQNLALGFRPVLDVALDVDGYLRQLPADSTPRARMFERYASLLRHLTAWRDDDGDGYEAIVLVAHSQGSVLTADLLDFLCREGDPDLPWIGPRANDDGPRLRLFTMGSPLAQLYARNFPHLYGWINGEPPGWFPCVPAADGATFTPRRHGGHHTDHHLTGDRYPEPACLGTERWVNAYRSGDYVGRNLWRHETDDDDVLWLARHRSNAPPDVVHTVSEDASGRRRELCLGSGAHTHYWDSTADAVAFELDLLIR